MAVWIVPNVEYFEYESLAGPSIASVAAVPPDVANYSWRLYGTRIGVWRMFDILQELGLPPTVALNSGVCEHYPEIVNHCVEQGWELIAHGQTNSAPLPGLAVPAERALIRQTLTAIEVATGKRPVGWLGPSLAETAHTIDLLAEQGVRYVCDWVGDEQPAELIGTTHRLISLPYSLETNDISIFLRRGHTGPQYGQLLRDQFDELYRESSQTARVMCIALHPFITGVPHRAKYLREALIYMTGFPDVWFATGAELADLKQ